MATSNTSKLRALNVNAPNPGAASAPVVRAIDVGFGLVKASLRSGDGVAFINFPSMAIPADASAVRSLSTRRRDTFDVPVNDALYAFRIYGAGGEYEGIGVHNGGTKKRRRTERMLRSIHPP